MNPIRTALKMLATMIILTGLIYPLLITAIAALIMPKQAGGSLVRLNDRVLGSELIAQSFKEDIYFWPRPSAIDYDPIKPSGGSNLGPTSQKLKEIVEARAQALQADLSVIPSELVYASGSGLDPHISLEAAFFQMERVARARSIEDISKLRFLIQSLAQGFGNQYVNVLLLNQALNHQFPLQ